jgi:hypothetical protein
VVREPSGGTWHWSLVGANPVSGAHAKAARVRPPNKPALQRMYKVQRRAEDIQSATQDTQRCFWMDLATLGLPHVHHAAPRGDWVLVIK